MLIYIILKCCYIYTYIRVFNIAKQRYTNHILCNTNLYRHMVYIYILLYTYDERYSMYVHICSARICTFLQHIDCMYIIYIYIYTHTHVCIAYASTAICVCMCDIYLYIVHLCVIFICVDMHGGYIRVYIVYICIPVKLQGRYMANVQEHSKQKTSYH